MIKFKHSTEKEIENYFNVMKSINDPGVQPKIYYQVKEIGLDPESRKDVLDYFKSLASSREKIIKIRLNEYEQDWRRIEKEFFARTDKFFATKTTMDNLTAYLTFTGRCGYNIKNEYFFLNMGRNNSNAGIIHEILHFYTHKLIQPIFVKKKISYSNFNDFKEALVFVMNIKYKDLLPGHYESGYEKQKEIFKFLEKNYQSGDSVYQLVNIYLKKYSK